MEKNDALIGQKDELENEQTDLNTTDNQPQQELPESETANLSAKTSDEGKLSDDEEEIAEESSDEGSSIEEEQVSEDITESMEDLLDEQELELDFPKQGEVRQGAIASITESEILVSVGTKSEGIISGRELEGIPDDEREEFVIGADIPVYVVSPEDSYGNVVLSYTRAREEQDWEEVGRLLETEDVVESKIIGYNKGGLIVPIGRLRGFVPASQVSLLRRMSATGDTPEQRWGEMLEEPIEVRIIEVDRERRRLILSERLALDETRESLKDRLLDELEEGDIRTGRVTSLAEFGAFVNIEGADGLVHLSEISWERISHPNEVLEIGQEVEVKVISIDLERKRIGLSIRQLQDDPWIKSVEHLREGMLVEGTVTHLTKFGAFSRIGEDLEGLIHVSELSEQRIAHPKEVVHEGDVVTLRIIKIDTERHRIGLSLRKVDSPAYADLDWKMALAQEVGKSQAGEEEEEARSILIESEGEDAEVEAALVEAAVEEAVEQAEEDLAETVVEAAVLEAVAEEAVEQAEDAVVDAFLEEANDEETIEEAVADLEEAEIEAALIKEAAEEAVEEAEEDLAKAVIEEAVIDAAVEEAVEQAEEDLLEAVVEAAIIEEAAEEAVEDAEEILEEAKIEAALVEAEDDEVIEETETALEEVETEEETE
ncbi:MAG: S1 RNA-binding domain-containing protein [Chloroflexota bacterium]|nr:S1 RNA-binding domain-containing protein [Chloroflexota bacterium]